MSTEMHRGTRCSVARRRKLAFGNIGVGFQFFNNILPHLGNDELDPELSGRFISKLCSM
jgi:hypothetical protein